MSKFLKWVIYITMGAVPFMAVYVSGLGMDVVNKLLGTNIVPFDSMLFPYITGKNFAFRVLVEVAAAAWLMLMIVDERYRPKKSLLLYAYTAFISALLLADIFSVNPVRSFFSNFERMEGFISHAHLFLYFIILISVYKSREKFEEYKSVLLISNIPVLLVAYLQLLGTQNIFSNMMPALRDSIHKLFFPSQGGTQLDSTLGNSTYLAIYTVFFIFFFFARFVENKIKKTSYMFPLIMVILNLIVLNYTGTRGAQAGFVFGAVVASLIILISGKRFVELKKLRKYALAFVLFTILSISTLIAINGTSVTKNNPRLDRVAQVANLANPLEIYSRVNTITDTLYGSGTYTDLLAATLNQGTLASRALNIKMSLAGFAERPLLGWGQDNYFYVFAKHNDARMYAQESWFDRSHNVFMDWLIAAGALGLIAYLALYFVAIYTMWFARATRKYHDSYVDLIEKALLTGLLVAYFVHNIFVFDNLVSYILFFFTLAYIAIRFDHTVEVKEREEKGKSSIVSNVDDRVVMYGPFILIGLLASLYFLNYQYIKANKSIIGGLAPQTKSGDTGPIDALARSLESFKVAAGIGGIAMVESREQLAQQTLSLINQLRSANLPQTETSLPIYKLVYEFINTTKSEYESLINSQKNMDPRTMSIFATFSRATGDMDNALKHSKMAHEYAPMKQTISADYVQILLANKNFDEAVTVAQKMYESDKSYEESRSIYAVALAYAGRYEEAEKVAPELKSEIEKLNK